MTAVGVICEYNPFHNGHKYHLEKAREITGADIVVALMSGNFVQRGDVAVFDKKIRANAALLNGADLVIELPAVMSLCSAERFASASVEILNALSAIDFISFGAENADTALLENIAKILCEEPPLFKTLLAENLNKGMSYATARGEVISSLLPEAKETMASPNNILAIEYLKALLKSNSSAQPTVIKREGSGYNCQNISDGFISATGARKLISDGISLSGFVPDNTLPLYKNAKIHNIKNMEKAIIANLCKMTTKEIRSLPDVSEGLENKILKAANSCNTFGELCDNIKSKRYTHSRIRRIVLNSFLGIKKEDLLPPQYIKILDFNCHGQSFLNKIKQEALMPLVKNYNQIRRLNNINAENMWKKELLFDRLYELF